MARRSSTLRDQNETPIGGALVVVQASDTGLLPVLTTDDGAVLPNPFVTYSDGTYVYNVDPGIYDETYRYGGRVIGVKYSIPIGDVSTLPEGSVVDFLGTSTTLAPSQRAVSTIFNTQLVQFARDAGSRIGSYTHSPLWPSVTGSNGNAVVEQITYYDRLSLNNLGDSGGTGNGGTQWMHQAVVANVGGPEDRTVCNPYYAMLIHNSPSPNHPNPNMGGFGANIIGESDGRCAAGNMSLVGQGSYVLTGATATYYNMCGSEVDVGSIYTLQPGMDVSTFNARALVNRAAHHPSRTGYAAYALGLQQGGDEASDGAFRATLGIQLNQSQLNYPYMGGWRFLIGADNGSGGTDARYNQPIHQDGGVLRLTAYGAGWTQRYGLDMRAASFTDVVFATTYNVLYEDHATFKHADHQLFFGAAGANSNPRLLFLTGPNSTNYDSGIFGVAGTGGSIDGVGALAVIASDLRIAGSISPQTANTGLIGLSARPFAGGYVQTALAVTSDGRNKSDVTSLTQKFFDFWMKLRAVTYVLTDHDVPEKTTVVKGMRPSGEVRHVPITDENGDTVMVTPVTRNPDKSSETLDPVPSTHAEDVMVEKDITHTIPAHSLSYSRTHVGWIAQEVWQALKDSGLEPGDDSTKSVLALFLYEADTVNADGSTGTCMLRLTEFIAIGNYVDQRLYAMFNSQESRIETLEARFATLEAKVV